MNKTVTVNIGGIVFHIEEQAYERLLRYLESIKGYFRNTEGSDEIINDIENRIAEMFQDATKDSREVIVPDDVEKVIDAMGRPEQFNDENQTDEPYTSSVPHRRLFRDPDDKLIGGVCSGISHYFGFEPIWLRLIFLIAFLFFGTGFLLYIILLVIVPKAQTAAEKLQMRGEHVNIGSIKNTVQDGVNDLRDRISDLGEEARNIGKSGTVKRTGAFIERTLEAIIMFIVGAFKLVVKFIGVLLLIAAIGILVAFAIAIFAIIGISGVTLPVYISSLVLSSGQQFWLITGLFLAIALPLLLLVIRLLMKMFDTKVEWKWFGRGGLTLFAAGVIILIITSANIASEFNRTDRNRSSIALTAAEAPLIYLDLNDNVEYSHEAFLFDDNFVILNQDDTAFHFSEITLDIQKSMTDKFELTEFRTAHGRSKKEAYNNSSGIIYKIAQKDSLIKFDEYFSLKKGIKYRGQHLKYILYVPVGSSVHLGNGIREIIYDIDNVTNTYDGDMVGHTWTMTDQGLECIECPGITKDIDVIVEEEFDKKDGVVFRSKDGEIIIQDDRIEIDGGKNKITIEKN